MLRSSNFTSKASETLLIITLRSVPAHTTLIMRFQVFRVRILVTNMDLVIFDPLDYMGQNEGKSKKLKVKI